MCRTCAVQPAVTGHRADGDTDMSRVEQCAKHDLRVLGHRSHLLVPSMAEQSHPYGIWWDWSCACLEVVVIPCLSRLLDIRVAGHVFVIALQLLPLRLHTILRGM